MYLLFFKDIRRMAYSQDQLNTLDKNTTLSHDLSVDIFVPIPSRSRSHLDPSEDCLPDDPICVPSKTLDPNYGEQQNQPMSTYDQVNIQSLMNIQSDESHMDRSPPAYSLQSFDYHDRIPPAYNDSVVLHSAPTSSCYAEPVVQRQYDSDYPNPPPYYLPQQSQATQQQQVIYIVAQRPVNPESFENSYLECSTIAAIVLSIFSLLLCLVFGGFTVSLASE